MPRPDPSVGDKGKMKATRMKSIRRLLRQVSPHRALARSLPVLALAAGLLIMACGVGSESDRDATVVSGLRIDSLKIIPDGSRFCLRDSLTRVLFKGVHLGFACSQVLEMDLDSPTGSPAAYGPLARLRLPAAPDCPIDTIGRDSVVTHAFRSPEAWLRVANSSGKITDSARLVAGKLAFDSLTGKFDTTFHLFSSGHFSVTDSGAGRPRALYMDTLACGQYLNQGEYIPQGESLKVRLSIVTLDADAAPDSCRGEAMGKTHDETIFIRKAR